MVRRCFTLVSVAALATAIIAGCTQAPAPAPTQPPAKAAEPTKAAAPAQPTAAPAKQVSFPAGKPISMIVPYAAGGSVDVAARIISPFIEKDLATSVQVVNKAGAASQVGLTDLVNSKPDGYTLAAMVLPTAITHYVDPERKAPYTRKDFAKIAFYSKQPIVALVKADSPYKTMKDLVDAAKAKPNEIKAGTSGIMGTPHVTILQLQKASGAKFASVHFEGGAPTLTALLGGHIDVAFNVTVEVMTHYKAGTVRILGIADDQQSKYYPDVPTFASQGYKVSMSSMQGMVAPGGTPKEVVDVLAATIKKGLATGDVQKKLDDAGYVLMSEGPAEFESAWAALEEQIRPLVADAK